MEYIFDLILQILFVQQKNIAYISYSYMIRATASSNLLNCANVLQEKLCSQ